MNTNRRCGCKSFNSCYLCEAEYGLTNTEPALERIDVIQDERIFCPVCQRLYPAATSGHICGQGQPFHGLELLQDFVSIDEERTLVHNLDEIPWDTSQSGRRKQNFGPKANFKKRQAKVGSFIGYPLCTKFIQDRFNQVPSLEDYKTVEQCSIEYRPETGARIDPHIDDCWVWGERIVQLNLLANSVLTLLPYKGDPNRFNLADVKTYPKIIDSGKVIFNPFKHPWITPGQDNFVAYNRSNCDVNCVIRVPLPRRSLLVMYGAPRYDWEHCILRRDIASRRIVIAYREFTPTYLPNGPHQAIGKPILTNAEQFF
jgi:alkylated DNA repair protein alkB family protein 4